MKYIKNNFHVEDISTQKIAKKFKTPLYCYSYLRIKNNINKFKNHFKKIKPLICFSVKSNSNLSLLKEIKKFGLGADVVSKGEMIKAITAGINSKKIVFSGVGKTFEEIEFAAKKKILLINVESESEIETIKKVAKKNKKSIDIGIRLNPNVDAKTIRQITTGKYSNKFGLIEKDTIKLIKKYKSSKYLSIKCLSVHIGSQITSHVPYLNMLKSIQKIIDKTKFNFEYVDLGGGMGINYGENRRNLDYKKYSKQIEKFIEKNKVKIIFEPGRSIIGNAGYLLSKIIYIKKTTKINFIILDTGMNDLIRPALYKAFHKIIPTKRKFGRIFKKHEFVGPICETTDKFLSTKYYQKLNEGDNVVICDVGAYGKVLSSNYNLRNNADEIIIKNSKVFKIGENNTLKKLINR